MQTHNQALFPLGTCTATPGALQALEDHARDPRYLLWRHQHGDWGVLDAEDYQANVRAVQAGARVFSVYPLSDEVTIWCITEADRSFTTLLLPSEY